MTIHESHGYRVAVIGAGPAGLFAAKQLAANGVRVVIFNRDIKPGGLAEYGIYPDKLKMKEGLRKQFRQVLASPHIEYFGNVIVGQSGDLTLDEVRGLGFHAVLVTVGAQGTKWLGLPGEDLAGVYHAKDLVYHYNGLPPFSRRRFEIGRRAVIVGVGNVMMDVAHYLIRDRRIDEVVAVARRGPAEVKFDKAEMEVVVRNIDLAALVAELERCRPVMEAVGQSVSAAREYILAALPRALEPVSNTRFRFHFLASPMRIIGDAQGCVAGLEVEDTTLVLAGQDTKARGLGTTRVIDADTVVFAIGDQVDPGFGLPVRAYAFVKNPSPRFPVEGQSYEAYDPATDVILPDVFVAGWSREASTGLVGLARKDGTAGANVVLQYLRTLPATVHPDGVPLRSRLAALGKPVITKADWQRLEAIEQAEAQRRGLEFFKYTTNEAMLAALGLAGEAVEV